jgi:hypothetical protein
MDRSKTYPLAHPVEFEESTISEVTLRPATGATLRALARARAKSTDRDNMSEAFTMLSLVSGHPEGVFDRMDASDVVLLLDAVTDFFPGTPEDGGAGGVSSPTVVTS